MSGSGKRSFTNFVRPATVPANHTAPQSGVPPSRPELPAVPPPAEGLTNSDPAGSGAIAPSRVSDGNGQGSRDPERTRVVTPTGRVRTYTASRNLPGVTLRLSEQRWERLKLLSIQQRRPIQEILGEAIDDYMRARGLPW